MATPSSLIALSFLLLASSATAFNITRILGSYPNYSVFNDFLTQNHLNVEINKRQTITVLTVPNDQMGALQGTSKDVVKKVMQLHVVLDYYDPMKLKNMKKSTLLTTLYQTSGVADSNEGFVNTTVIQGEVKLGSGAKGAPLNAQLVKSVVAQPFNISVLEISAPIIPPSVAMDGKTIKAPTAAPKSSPSPSKAPAPAPKKSRAPSKAPTPSPADAPSPADGPVADGPDADSPDANAPTSDDSPASASAPAPADGPAADGPAADAPAADVPASDDAPAPASSGTTVVPGIVGALIMVCLSSWVN